jgi:ElaA protein
MLHWHWKPFHALTLEELYQVLALRQQVFVVEQRSLYLDADGHDAQAWHLLGVAPGEGVRPLEAYLRAFAPGAKYAEASLGRVVVSPAWRGRGLGRALMREGLAWLAQHHPGAPVRLSAQLYLKRFYEELGFRGEGDVYDEDGIPHLQMVR